MSPTVLGALDVTARLTVTLGLLAWATFSDPPQTTEAAVVVGLVGYWLGEGMAAGRRRLNGALVGRESRHARPPRR